MASYFNSPKKKVLGFFLVYGILMASLILGVVKKDKAGNETLEQPKSEVSHTFQMEMKKYEQQKIEKEIKNADKWKPSKRFVATSIAIASVLDVVIILIWARYENKKRAGKSATLKKRWTDQKWFWNIVALGIVQPKNNKIVVNWVNLIVVVMALYFLKQYFIDRLWEEGTSY
ncbi:hypothetical protein [Pseudoneobacillus sp. C159]